jgi:hypothetical protein
MWAFDDSDSVSESPNVFKQDAPTTGEISFNEVNSGFSVSRNDEGHSHREVSISVSKH